MGVDYQLGGGAMAVAVAKWLGRPDSATGFCTRKRVQSALGKLRWLARPHACLSPVMARPCAHSLWGPRFHTPIAVFRSLALVLALSFKVWPPWPFIPTRPSSLGIFFVDTAKQCRKYA